MNEKTYRSSVGKVPPWRPVAHGALIVIAVILLHNFFVCALSCPFDRFIGLATLIVTTYGVVFAVISLRVALHSLNATTRAANASVSSSADSKYYNPGMRIALETLHNYRQRFWYNKELEYVIIHRGSHNFQQYGISIFENGKLLGFDITHRILVPRSMIHHQAEIDKLAANLKSARRTVKDYFWCLAHLYDEGFISREVLRAAADKPGIVAMFEIVEPMEKISNPDYDKESFELLFNECRDIYYSQIEKNKHLNVPSALPAAACRCTRLGRPRCATRRTRSSGSSRRWR